MKKLLLLLLLADFVLEISSEVCAADLTVMRRVALRNEFMSALVRERVRRRQKHIVKCERLGA